jgi:hypothetical protein
LCRVSCVLCRVSCVVCRVSCVLCLVSCVVCLVSCAIPQGGDGALSSTRAHVAEHRLVRFAPRGVERPSRPSYNTGAPEGSPLKV